MSSSAFAMAQGAPFENVFQEVLGEGHQAGSGAADGLCAQLKDDRTAHAAVRWRGPESWIPL